ncbi:palmitoyltransferase ZDHHC12-B-like [Lineus longissimus]|uniref:palmitoyltransferase ZDHHC12-B-like n=1 Tax=Lineus longissimus TaxID=88925 RepID=UPI002B4E84DA
MYNIQAALQAKALMRKHRKWVKLAIRTFNTILCLGIPLTLVTKDSELHRHMHDDSDPTFELIYLILVIVSLVAYYVVCFTDPGFVPTAGENKSPRIFHESHLLDMFGDDDGGDEHSRRVAEETHGVHRRCGFCGIQQPLRSHHCHDCGRCVRKFDHHCPWVETCIGEGTHKYFLIWLFIFEVLILWTTKMTWGCFTRTDTWYQWFTENFILLMNMFWLSNGVCVVTGLLCFHSYIMCVNQTTWEMISHSRITYLKHLSWSHNPFHQGYIQNVRDFLCRRRYRSWEDLYFRNTRSGVNSHKNLDLEVV